MNGQSPKKVVLAAGGTGGHMFPAQALARELLARDIAVTLITDQRGGGFGPDLPQVETYRISAGAIAGGGLIGKALGVCRLMLGAFQARRLLVTLAPDRVVGFGGYPSVPTVMAAAHAGLPIVLHEQNAVLGRANRLLAGRAQAIATSFPAVQGFRDEDRAKTVLTGNPVRSAIAALARKPTAVAGDDDKLHLLVTGGSQGASVFNELVPQAIAALPEPLRRRLSVTQQVRGDVTAQISARYHEAGVACELAAFFDDLPARLAKAQLVICRSGASTVAELAAAGRPAILVPYPHATDDHQRANAEALAEAGGGWLMPQATLTSELLAERLAKILGEPAVLTRAAHCAAATARLEAAKSLAELVLGLLPRTNGASPSKGRDRKDAAA
ncbi:MAG: undecaprenyldiphospho-muramoylpentapeptide beta-N-acetylglucosaminyltransferase [Pseudomonadota bacterium]